MDEDTRQFIRTIFLQEIISQCQFALAAYSAIQRQENEPSLFYHIQSFLISGANVSKVLFPGGIQGNQEFKSQCHQRAKELRDLLGVADDSILSNRDLRNHFEHFDERIQRWATRPGPKIFIDSNVVIGGTVAQAIKIGGTTPQDYFRQYTSPPPTVTFQEDTYLLVPIATALQEVMRAAQQHLNTK